MQLIILLPDICGIGRRIYRDSGGGAGAGDAGACHQRGLL